MTNYRVYICAGPNCTPKGSAQLLRFLEEELARLSLQEEVSVFAGGCQSHCETGPSVVVYPGPVFYQYVDKPRLVRIAREHLANDVPVADYFHHDTRSRQPKSVPHPHRSGTTFPKSWGGNGDKAGKKPKPKKSYEVDDFKW
jgi:(2Fe-2S) ferredoxin